MKTRILIMIPGKPEEIQEIDWDPKKTFDEQLKPWLGKCWTEHVYVRRHTDGNAGDMFVDEMGALKGEPINEHNARHRIYPGNIYGPAVLFLDHKVWK